MLAVWAFINIENKHTLYHGEDCMKKFFSSLKEHATNIINFEKTKMLPLTKKELKLGQEATECYICVDRFLTKLSKSTNYRKVSFCQSESHCHYTGKYRVAAHSVCNLKFIVPNEIPVIFHNGLNYHYYSIIKELPNEFEGKFECLGENTEKYKTFSIPIEKIVTETDKDSARFMTTSLSNLVYNLTEGIHKIVFLNMKLSRII